MNEQDFKNALTEMSSNMLQPLKRLMEMVEHLFQDSVKARDPDFDTKNLSGPGFQQWVMEYRERKHVFAYTTTAAVTLSSGAEWNFPLTQNVWTNLGAPAGVKFTPSVACIIQFKFTDEVIP